MINFSRLRVKLNFSRQDAETQRIPSFPKQVPNFSSFYASPREIFTVSRQDAETQKMAYNPKQAPYFSAADARVREM